MRLIKPSFEIIEQQAGLEGVYKQIELAGRTCYKSEDKITETSSKEFVDKMIKSGHGAMLEHGTVYLKFDNGEDDYKRLIHKYIDNKYSIVSIRYYPDPLLEGFVSYYVTTNLRVLVENSWMEDLKYICEPTKFHEKRITVRFICDRGVSHEFVRHRVFSFAQESTRYCNYSKDKFGGELTFIIPKWCPEIAEDSYISLTSLNLSDYDFMFMSQLLHSETIYLDLMKQWSNKVPDKRYKSGYRNNPWTPQQARAILPNALKTELVMTGFTSDWEHFFELRDANSAHPQARELAHSLHIEFIKRGYIKIIYN